MTASKQTVLMGLGARALEIDWDAEIAPLLLKGYRIRTDKGAKTDDTWIITQREILTDDSGKASGISLAGVSADWLLGLENEGPLIEDDEFLACNNKIFNPGFELGDLYYRLGQDTAWVVWPVTPGPPFPAFATSPETGIGWASVNRDPVDEAYLPLDDDILEVDQDYDVRPGQAFNLVARVRRLAGWVGRLRLRVLFSGRFNHPNILPSFDSGLWDDISEFAGDTSITGATATIGPCTRKQLIADPSFEIGDFAAWALVDGVEQSDGGRSGTSQAAPNSFDLGGSLVFQGAVMGGEEYDIEGWTRVVQTMDNGNSASGTVLAYGTGDIVGAGPFEQAGQVDLSWDDLLARWNRVAPTYRIPDDQTSLWLQLTFFGIDIDNSHCWDDVTITRTHGNRCALAMNIAGTVIPNRSYDGSIFLNPRAGFVSGTVKVIATFTAAGRTDITQELLSVDPKPGESQRPTFTMKPPSGYDTWSIRVEGLDILGDGVDVSVPMMADGDTGTLAVDVKSNETEPAYADLTQAPVVPDGAEKMRVQMVAESQSAGWEWDNTSLARVGVAELVADVASNLLFDPDTGNELLTPGVIHPHGTLTSDWHVVNLHNRDALLHLLQGGLCADLLEYRVNPDATVDIGTAAELFADRVDIILTGADIDVTVPPSVREDATNHATHIKVIGATRQKPDGSTFTITAEAEVPWDLAMVDLNGAPLHRVRVVENSTLNHPDYAQAYVDFLADQEAHKPKACTVKLSSDRARGAAIKEGQTIYVHAPDAGLEDITNPQRSEDGEQIFPEAIRVLSVTETYGEGDLKAWLLVPGEDPRLLEGVRWADANEIELQLGAFVPDFVVNDQEDVGKQFVRYRAATIGLR